MKLHLISWKEPEPDGELSAPVTGRRWFSSEYDASKFATKKKDELRDADGRPMSVVHKAVEVDNRRNGLIDFLNKLAANELPE